MAIMTYVVQKNTGDGAKQWLSRAKPTVIWGDKRARGRFHTRSGALEGCLTIERPMQAK